MPKILDGALLDGVQVDRESSVLLHHQVFTGMRDLILSGSLASETRLPSTRGLMQELGVSRNTVRQAYDQLIAEGYLHGRDGSGTFVAASIPNSLPPPPTQTGANQRKGVTHDSYLSRRGRDISNTRVLQGFSHAKPFAASLPALDQFPVKSWNRVMARQWNRRDIMRMGYGAVAGYKPLRESVASYLRTARGVSCEWDQVIIISGTQQAFHTMVNVLLDPGDSVWVEEPSFRGIHNIIEAAGNRPIPVPVDELGLSVEAGLERDATARAVIVSPSHQYPLGVTMPLSRRLEILGWAYRTNSWVIEDDTDSEFRYSGKTIPALQGIDRHERVIYVGTFSKILSPALRIGYLVVPKGLVDPVCNAIGVVSRGVPTHLQSAMADFMIEGHLATHIRRMRKVCMERQQTLLDAVHQKCHGLLSVDPTDTGLHVVGWLPDDIDDVVAYEAAMKLGIETYPISQYYSSLEKRRGGLMLGFASSPPDEIAHGVGVLATALRDVQIT